MRLSAVFATFTASVSIGAVLALPIQHVQRDTQPGGTNPNDDQAHYNVDAALVSVVSVPIGTVSLPPLSEPTKSSSAALGKRTINTEQLSPEGHQREITRHSKEKKQHTKDAAKYKTRQKEATEKLREERRKANPDERLLDKYTTDRERNRLLAAASIDRSAASTAGVRYHESMRSVEMTAGQVKNGGSTSDQAQSTKNSLESANRFYMAHSQYTTQADNALNAASTPELGKRTLNIEPPSNSKGHQLDDSRHQERLEQRGASDQRMLDKHTTSLDWERNQQLAPAVSTERSRSMGTSPVEMVDGQVRNGRSKSDQRHSTERSLDSATRFRGSHRQYTTDDDRARDSAAVARGSG